MPTQRNIKKQPEMETPANAAAKEKPEPKKRATKKAAAAPAVAALAPAQEEKNEGLPEGGLAQPVTQTLTPPDLNVALKPESQSSLKYCPVCENYLYMQVDAESQELKRLCRKCGYKEESSTDSSNNGLVMEMMIQQKSTEGYKVLLNEFTRKDPRLPHIRKNITCPNTACESNHGKEPDVIYIKYDIVNLMYLYICDICGEQWHSRSRL
jgi:DNA-directed RNA polymerase subunit M/transcription elongation factor TFIIS